MKPVKEGFECDTCAAVHYNEADAESCCPNTYTEVFVCSECETGWDNEKEAEDCCQ